jgi:diguanylate cyclase (GGDEF)-like protein
VTWLIIDLLTSLISLAGVSLIWRSQLPINWGFENFILLSFCLAFLFSGVNFITGLNRIDWPRATIQDAIALGLSGACVTFVILVLDVVQMYLQIIPLPALPIPMIVTIGMVAFGGFFITRFRWRILTTIASRWIIWRRNRSGVGERIVIVGSGEGCQTATWLLNRERYLYAFSVVGIVDDDVLPKKDMRIDGYKILGRFNDLPNLVAKYDVGLIIFTTPSIPPEINEFVHDLAKAGTVRLIYLEKLIKFVDQQLMSKDILLSHHLGPEENLEFLATHSELTGLPNSYLFKYQLRHSIAYSKRYQNNLAVLLINLEGYEDIVKSHGRNYGKEILKETARRLIRCKRESDLLACLRESKFALILENVQDCDTVDVVIHRINDILNEPVKVDGQVFNLSTSTKSFVGVKSCEESRLIEDFYIESN